jgi:hypothetical protein
MPTIIIVNKTGELVQTNVKSNLRADLYKKAGFKTDGENNPFLSHHNWNINTNGKTYNIHMYGKTNGRANQENKFEFPPPISTFLFFGNVILTNVISSTEIGDLSLDEWNALYNKLYGGFEDIGETDSTESEDAEEDINNTNRTCDGYVKDGFVVSDDDYEEYDGVDKNDEGDKNNKSKNKGDKSNEDKSDEMKNTKKRSVKSSTVSTPKITRKKKNNDVSTASSHIKDQHEDDILPNGSYEPHTPTYPPTSSFFEKENNEEVNGYSSTKPNVPLTVSNSQTNIQTNDIGYTSELEEEPYI